MISLDTIQKKIDLSLEGLKESTSRSRTVFIFYNLAAVLVFIALFNQEYSWQENINYIDRPYTDYVARVGIDSSKESYNELRKHYADMYFDRQFFNVPLLGIKCSGSDLTIYAPLAMIIFTTWFFFTARRENHILLEIFSDFKKIKSSISSKKNEDQGNFKLFLHYIYVGCIQHFVLITVSKNDYMSKFDDGDSVKYSTNKIARPVLDVLIWMPLIILLFVLFTDISDIIYKYDLMKKHLIEYAKLDGFLLISCVLIYYQIFCTKKIILNTSSILKHMSNVVKDIDYNY